MTRAGIMKIIIIVAILAAVLVAANMFMGKKATVPPTVT